MLGGTIHYLRKENSVSEHHPGYEQCNLAVAGTVVSRSLIRGEPIIRSGTVRDLFGTLFDLVPPDTLVQSTSWGFNPEPWSIYTTTERKVVTFHNLRFSKFRLRLRPNASPEEYWKIEAIVISEGWSTTAGLPLFIDLALKSKRGLVLFSNKWEVNLACKQSNYQFKMTSFASMASWSWYDELDGAEISHSQSQAVSEC